MTASEAVPLSALARLVAAAPPRPPEPGVVYRHLDATGNLLYVGSTTARAMRTRQLGHVRSARWWRFVARVEYDQHEGRRAALGAERTEIHTRSPIFNRTRPGGIDEQEAREAAYLAAHADVRDEWRPVMRALRRLDPVTRRARIDVLLRAVGVPAEVTP